MNLKLKNCIKETLIENLKISEGYADILIEKINNKMLRDSSNVNVNDDSIKLYNFINNNNGFWLISQIGSEEKLIYNEDLDDLIYDTDLIFDKSISLKFIRETINKINI